MRKKTIKPLKNQRGVAILLALFTFVLVSAVAMELLEETQVEYISASQSINQIQSYYAAKSGVELSLLRILMYKKARFLAGDNLGPQAAMLDKIWQFPLIWPPQLPDHATIVDKELLKSTLTESLIKAPFATQISVEGSKIDLNALGSKSKILADNSRNLILELFRNKMEADEQFRTRYRSFDFERLVNNITDWVDEDNESKNGGDEKGYYSKIDSDEIPPNQPFKTTDEIHMVAEMTDDLFDVLSKSVTIYGIAGINVNQADKEILRAIDPGIDERIADEIIARRNDPEKGGPFAKLEDFTSFLQSQGLTLDQEKLKKEGIPLVFGESLNFRVTSTAAVGQTRREIVAIVYDFDRVKERLSEILKEDEENTSGENEDGKDDSESEECKDKEGDEKYECLCKNETGDDKDDCIASQKQKDQKKSSEQNGDEEGKKKEPPKGRPNVVFWFEN